MAIYEESWNRPHTPGPEDRWQESDWLTFYDPDVGVGGIYRIGQEPNRRMGQPGLFVFARGGQRFFIPDLGGRGVDTPITPEDRWASGYRVEGHEVEALGDGRMRYRWKLSETEGEIEFCESFYTPRNWSNQNKGSDHMASLNAGGHLECAGRLRGNVRIGDARYVIDCFGHRDRSWGYRPAYVPRTRRIMVAWATTGPDFSFATMLYELADAPALHTGFVSRNGKTDEVADVRIISTLDADMASPLAGTVILTLDSGEIVRVDAKIAQGHGGWAPGTAFNSVGTFTRNGKRGFCDIGVYVNAADGMHVMTAEQVISSVVSTGTLSRTIDLTLPEERIR